MDKAKIQARIDDLEQASVQMQKNITQMQANIYANQGAIQILRELLTDAENENKTVLTDTQEGSNE